MVPTPITSLIHVNSAIVFEYIRCSAGTNRQDREMLNVCCAFKLVVLVERGEGGWRDRCEKDAHMNPSMSLLLVTHLHLLGCCLCVSLVDAQLTNRQKEDSSKGRTDRSSIIFGMILYIYIYIYIYSSSFPLFVFFCFLFLFFVFVFFSDLE